MEEPDLEAIDEQLWELYLAECQKLSLQPSYKDYLIWVEERY